MRTIEFRVWDQDLGVMITPSNSDQFAIGLSGELIDVGCVFTSQIKNISKGVVVEQFTGLLDKNGTKIFEGDIVQSYHYTDSLGVDYFITHTVYWYEKFSGWYMVGEDDQGDGDGSVQMWVYMKSSSSIEVIGNIHEAK